MTAEPVWSGYRKPPPPRTTIESLRNRLSNASVTIGDLIGCLEELERVESAVLEAELRENLRQLLNRFVTIRKKDLRKALGGAVPISASELRSRLARGEIKLAVPAKKTDKSVTVDITKFTADEQARIKKLLRVE